MCNCDDTLINKILMNRNIKKPNINDRPNYEQPSINQLNSGNANPNNFDLDAYNQQYRNQNREQYPPPPIQPIQMVLPPPPQIPILDQNNTNPTHFCQSCGRQTASLIQRKIGTAAVFWFFCLFFFTGVLCLYPFFTDSCRDANLICTTCNTSKRIIHANIC